MTFGAHATLAGTLSAEGRPLPGRRSARSPGEQQRAGDGPAPVAHRSHLGRSASAPVDLAVAALAPELHAGLVDEPEAVEPATGELASGGVEGERPLEGDGRAVLDERPALP